MLIAVFNYTPYTIGNEILFESQPFSFPKIYVGLLSRLQRVKPSWTNTTAD